MLESDLNEVAEAACRILATGRPVTAHNLSFEVGLVGGFDHDEFEMLAEAVRQVVANGEWMTGSSISGRMPGDDWDGPFWLKLHEMVKNVLDGLGREPFLGTAVVDIGDIGMDDFAREVWANGNTVVSSADDIRQAEERVVAVVEWGDTADKVISEALDSNVPLIVACHDEDDIDEAWADIEDIAGARWCGPASAGTLVFQVTKNGDTEDMSRRIDRILGRLSRTGLSFAGPGVTGDGLAARLPNPSRDRPPIKIINAESATSADEAREAMDLGFAVIACLDPTRFDRINPELIELEKHP